MWAILPLVCIHEHIRKGFLGSAIPWSYGPNPENPLIEKQKHGQNLSYVLTLGTLFKPIEHKCLIEGTALVRPMLDIIGLMWRAIPVLIM